MALPIGSGSRRPRRPGRAGRVLYSRAMLKALPGNSRPLAVLACPAASLIAFGHFAEKD